MDTPDTGYQSGDAFAAGFLHGRIRGLAPGACAEVANLVASRVVASEGCLYDSVDRASVSVSGRRP
jgi:sugar/nucleoside kinase (ribokinase family)